MILAQDYEPGRDYSGWLMSEKLDGIRAYWTGSQLVSRNGKIFPAPAEFLAALPSSPLDGELFSGRRNFQIASRAVWHSERFADLTYCVFDAPAVQGGFAVRHMALSEIVTPCDHIQVIPHAVCLSSSHAREALTVVERRGGEGIVLRHPAGEYFNGRSTDFRKLKSFRDDEGKVIGHKVGDAGTVSLVVEMPGGETFSMASGVDRMSPPAIGSTVTYRYLERTEKGLPRHAVYVGVRS